MNKRRFIGYFCLLIYFLAWIGSAQAIPLLLTSIGHAHKIFLAHRGDTLQITLHHPGHIDKHEPVPATSLKTYQHDLLDKALFILSNRQCNDYSDHLIQVPLDKPPHITSDHKIGGEIAKLLIAFSFLAITVPLPASMKCAYLLFLAPPLPPPDIPSAPFHLRTTVLLN